MTYIQSWVYHHPASIPFSKVDIWVDVINRVTNIFWNEALWLDVESVPSFAEIRLNCLGVE